MPRLTMTAALVGLAAALAGAGCDLMPGGGALVAYVVAKPGAAAPGEELRAHLRGRLPSYMVPAAVVAVEAIPLTANGKVDRAALPPPAFEASGRRAAPAGHTERVLARIWSEALGAPVWAEDDFFELGGHSLLAARIAARAGDALAARVSLTDVMRARTVRELARALAPAAGRDRRSPIPRAERRVRPRRAEPAADRRGGG